MTDGSGPPTTPRAQYMRLLVWSKACRHQVYADLVQMAVDLFPVRSRERSNASGGRGTPIKQSFSMAGHRTS